MVVNRPGSAVSLAEGTQLSPCVILSHVKRGPRMGEASRLVVHPDERRAPLLGPEVYDGDVVFRKVSRCCPALGLQRFEVQGVRVARPYSLDV